eukprot:5291240-Prymnesium_polylepis.4
MPRRVPPRWQRRAARACRVRGDQGDASSRTTTRGRAHAAARASHACSVGHAAARAAVGAVAAAASWGEAVRPAGAPRAIRRVPTGPNVRRDCSCGVIVVGGFSAGRVASGQCT